MVPRRLERILGVGFAGGAGGFLRRGRVRVRVTLVVFFEEEVYARGAVGAQGDGGDEVARGGGEVAGEEGGGEGFGVVHVCGGWGDGEGVAGVVGGVEGLEVVVEWGERVVVGGLVFLLLELLLEVVLGRRWSVE